MRVALLLIGCVACSSPSSPGAGSAVGPQTPVHPTPAPAPAPTPPANPEPGSAAELAQQIIAVRGRMHTRLEAIRGIGNAIALSDLAQAQTEGRKLAALEDPEVLPQWQPFLAQVRISGEQLAQAKDIAAAAPAAARLGALCGSCHQTLSGHATYSAAEQPAPGTTLASQMANHQWAAARLWDGLVGPSEERWMQGAQALSAIKIDVAEVKVKLELWTSKVRQLATDAKNTPAGDGRVALFGNLLTACAGCHAVIRDR
ncbi:MAG: hypothetical protein KBG15_22275 [Kofleriaceae bacterium]|nr:hypothetical protein [Kofleriaceae bacterium]